MRRSLTITLVLVGLLATAAPVAASRPLRLGSEAAAPREAVLNGRTSEVNPAAEGDVLMWAQNSRRRPRHYDTFLRVPGEGRRKLNNGKTTSFGGGISGDEAVFQVVRRGRSDLRLWDIDDAQALALPGGLNSTRWEWSPTNSDDLYLFNRDSFSRRRTVRRVVLFDRGDGSTAVLATFDRRGWVRAGQVAGAYAVWERCQRGGCAVFLYDAVSEDTERIPAPIGVHWQYTPAVAPDGTVFFFRSGDRCGRHVRLMQKPLGGPATEVMELPRGYDTFSADAYADSSGLDPIVYYGRLRCTTGASDIHRQVVS